MSSLEQDELILQQGCDEKSPESQLITSNQNEQPAQSKGKSQSIIGALPILDIPSEKIKRVIQQIPRSDHSQVAEGVFFNCRIAAFKFYSDNALWRTKFSSEDSPTDPKLFQFPNGGFPTRPEDLELRVWIFKVQHAIRRINEPDSISTDAIRNEDEGYSLEGAANILRLIYPWDLLNEDEIETSLCYAISFCRQLYAWDCSARLELFWSFLHPSAGDEDLNFHLLRIGDAITMQVDEETVIRHTRGS